MKLLATVPSLVGAHWRHVRPARALRNTTFRQTALLFASQIAVMALGVGTGALTTRGLGVEQYGVYSFTLGFVGFLGNFFGMGFCSSAARMLAANTDKSGERELVGSLFMIAGAQGFVFSVFVFGSGSVVDLVCRTHVRQLMTLAAFVSSSLMLDMMLTQVYRGTNQIGALALYTVAPKALYVAGALWAIRAGRFTAAVALVLNLGAILAACAVGICCLRPRLKGVRGQWQAIWKETKEYGFHVYLGSIMDTSTYKMDGLFIAGFVDTKSVGLYSLGQTLVSPMAQFSRSLSISLFRGFANSRRIAPRVLLFNAGFLAVSGLSIVLLGRLIVQMLFGPAFARTSEFLLPLAAAMAFQGLYTPMNMFLAAHRKGRELRFISLTLALVNVVGYSLTIPVLGALGAALVAAGTKFAELGMNTYFYRRAAAEAELS
jgi:O-antigen/teichoic acid export membrane protein